VPQFGNPLIAAGFGTGLPSFGFGGAAGAGAARFHLPNISAPYATATQQGFGGFPQSFGGGGGSGGGGGGGVGFGDGLSPQLLAALAQHYGVGPGGGFGGGNGGGGNGGNGNGGNGGGFGFPTDPATIAPLNASAAVGSPPMRGSSGTSGGTGGGPPRGPASAKSRIPQPIPQPNGANAPPAPDARHGATRSVAVPPPPPSGAVSGASRGLRAGEGEAPPEPPLRGPPSRAGARARNGALPIQGALGPVEASGAGARSAATAATAASKPTAALDRRGKAVSFG